MPHGSQDGLDWERGVLDTVPRWSRQPSIPAIENVCRQQLKVNPGGLCHVSFYAAGAFNKLYRVDCTDQSLLMRVSLPVHPHHKTRGEMTTLAWLRQRTSIPVPKVIAFDDSNDNEIGFEWILMELMSGSQLHQKWRTLSMEQKVDITQRIAHIQAELFGYGKPDPAFRGIGTLHTGTTRETDAGLITAFVIPGQLVSIEFFIGDRLRYNVPRGPFRSSYAWLDSQLRIIILEQTAAMNEAEDDDDKEDAEEILEPAQRLLSLLPKVFPNDEDAEEHPEPTVLWHDDLNMHNILVDEKGGITAIVDWECVSALPLWITTDMPKFLEGNNRPEKPRRDDYSDETPAESVASRDDNNPDKLDNEGKTSLYWIHRLEYETTQLREVYKTRLIQLWPDWPLQGS